MRGKFLGAVCGMRFFSAALLAVWGVGLALGSIHILSLIPALAHLVVYTSAFALIGMLLLTVLLVIGFIRDVAGMGNGVVPPMQVLASLIHLVAGLGVTVFFFAFHKAQA